MANGKLNNSSYKIIAAAIVLLALLFVPAPILPPHRLAEFIQSTIAMNWKAAYLFAAVGLQVIFYSSIGIVSAFVMTRASSLRGRITQVITLPLCIVLVAMIIRSLKMGHLPVWINAAIPVAACFFGVWLGLGLLYQRGKMILFISLAVIGLSFWLLSGTTTASLSRSTQHQLERLVSSSSAIPPGEERFGALLKIAFALPPGDPDKVSFIEQNRAAILALGIALGDEHISKYIGLHMDSRLIQQAILLREGTTLYGRADWPRHYCLSAALAVLENPLVSDAGGLMKEQLDALTSGSGFSFRDFAADRAGVRFANAATNSEKDAKAMQDLIMSKFIVGNFLPEIDDLPENLTTEQFRNKYGSVGSNSYRQVITNIEERLNPCIALQPLAQIP